MPDESAPTGRDDAGIDGADGDEPTPVSTGYLPAGETVGALVREAWERYRANDDGENAQHYPALAAMPRHLFGVCVVGTSGVVHVAGDADHPFTIMSVAKPFVFALVCEAIGPGRARAAIGVNATGLPFNSLAAVEAGPDGRTNPMVNSGALAATALVPGDSAAAKWAAIHDGLSRFAGRPLPVDEAVYASASATNTRNRAIAWLLADRDLVAFDPVETVDLYTRQSCLEVTARDLAAMAATLANGGVNPLTGDQVVDAATCRRVLAVMSTAGLYETSGDWLYDIGLPGKSGVGGGIITVAPGKGGLATFAPPLDAAGNSVRGQLAARFLAARLGLRIFASLPEARG